ncbi:MAG: UV DNA damage repair endonuclease UvsE [Desulfocucumaceae bacterium]
MLLRFGYVAMSVKLVDCSPSKAVTYKTYSSLRDKDAGAALGKLIRTARENLKNTLRLLLHSRGNNVKLYRFSSKIIPLATHPELSGWDYLEDVRDLLVDIGVIVKDSGMRVSFHPDHFTFINSPREEVFNASVKDYLHHCRMFEAMGLDCRAKLVTHIGGGYRDKSNSLGLFLKNWEKVPGAVAGRIALENDDKTFTAGDTLYLAEKLGLPVVFDLHHFSCNQDEGIPIGEIYPRLIATWKDSGLNPKIHVSSPRSDTDRRSHHDYVDPVAVYQFIKSASAWGQDLDVMVEAKKKDEAMFKLVRDLSGFPGIKQLNEAALQTNQPLPEGGGCG